MAKEEILMKLSMLEQQSEEIKKNLEEVDKQISGIEGLTRSLENLEKDKEILANLGKGIFVKSKILDDKVFMNVGSKTFVRKSFKEAVELIEKQIHSLSHVKQDLMENLNIINCELQKLVEEAQKESK